jgi:murein DD-endopeptidase MepM/ murein hydrolase activator NlpD
MGRAAGCSVHGPVLASGRPEAAPTSTRRPRTTAPRRLRSLLPLALAAGLTGIPLTPARALSDIGSARARLAAAQTRLDAATAAWQTAEARLARTRDDLTATEAARQGLLAEIARIQSRFQRRAVVAFETGPAGTIDLLLSSRSFTEFSDRMEFLGNMAQADSDLVVEHRVTGERLHWTERRLAELSQQQAAEASDLQARKEAIASDVADLQGEVERLRKQMQLAFLLGLRTIPGAAIQTCPVQGPNSFVDSFGWPRPGGRVHEGIDLIAPYGTPIVAVQPGTAVRTASTLGGQAVIVFGPGGDWTYYAHLSSYGATGRVGVGTMIGRVGSTGDAGTVNHLHFEYHPGGGAAVDPYLALRAVC